MKTCTIRTSLFIILICPILGTGLQRANIGFHFHAKSEGREELNLEWLELNDMNPNNSRYSYQILNLPGKIMLVSLLGVSWFIFMTTKIAIFMNIAKSRLSDRPINILIALEETTWSIVATMIVVLRAHGILRENPFGGEALCEVLNYALIGFLFTFSRAISWGTAVLRVTYITVPFLGASKKNEELFLSALVSVSILLSAVTTAILAESSGFGRNYIIALCTGYSQHFLEMTKSPGSDLVYKPHVMVGQ